MPLAGFDTGYPTGVLIPVLPLAMGAHRLRALIGFGHSALRSAFGATLLTLPIWLNAGPSPPQRHCIGGIRVNDPGLKSGAFRLRREARQFWGRSTSGPSPDVPGGVDVSV